MSARALVIACTMVLLTAPSGAGAQVVTARTGEHASFTRMVFSIPEGTTWELGRTAEGYILRIPDVAGFDLDGFFARIPRDRIVDARVTDGGDLLLTVTCLCRATAFLWRPDRLVVDINDGAPTANSRFETALDTAAPMPTPLPDVAGLSVIPELPAPTITRPQPRTEIDQQTLARRAADAAAVAALEQRILGSIAAAVEDGMVTANPDLAEAIGPPTDRNAAAELSGERPGFSIESAINGDPLLAELQSELDGLRDCVADDLADVASWGGEGSFGTQIAELRSSLTGEFDQIDPDAVEALARRYLSFGFGLEAIQTLQMDGRRSSARNVLTSIAEVMDGDPVTDTRFSRQMSCTGPVSLWGLLAHDDGPLPGPFDAQAIARHFRELPDLLRVHLAPRLSAKLSALGETDIAEIVLAPGLQTAAPSFEATVADVALKVDYGRKEEATADLAALAATDARMTPEALVQLMELQIAAGDRIPSAQFELLETFRFEFRGAPIAGVLSQMEVRAFVQNAAFDQAATALGQLTSDLAPSELSSLASLTAGGAAEKASDLTFLDIAFGDLPFVAEPAAQNAVAARLLSLGFAARAAEVIGGSASGQIMVERRYLRAEAALAQGAVDLAQAHLAGISTDRAEELRDRASRDGIPLSAVPSAAADWRAGDWGALAESGDDLLESTTALVLQEVDGALDSETPLASGRALLDGAENTRATIDALLSRFETPGE